MQETLRGIVLRTVKYGDTSIIVDLFTESHGRMSFMASTSRAKRSVRSVSFWQPLSMVEFSAELLPNGGKLPRPSDVRTYYNYIDLPFSPIKSTLALFLAEFLSAALREEKENTPLYRYIESSLQWLDLADSPASIANFHLAFLMHLSRFIGIYPNLDVSGNLNLNPNSPLSAVNSPLSTVHFQLSTVNSQLSTLPLPLRTSSSPPSLRMASSPLGELEGAYSFTSSSSFPSMLMLLIKFRNAPPG